MASFGNASGPVPPFAPGILGRQGLAVRDARARCSRTSPRARRTQAMADDLFAVVGSGAGEDPHRPALSAGRGGAGAPRPGSAQDHRLQRADALRPVEGVTPMSPATKYATSDGVSIAYQTLGDGPIDLLVVPGWVSNLDVFWEQPAVEAFSGASPPSRALILFDKRGTGLSDRVADLPSLEVRMDDVRAVLDAVGSERAALFGYSEGGPMWALFAATYPERTSALIMVGVVRADDAGARLRRSGARRRTSRRSSTRSSTTGASPSASRCVPRADDRRELSRAGGRASCAPARAHGPRATLLRMNNQIDIRHVLPSIRVPTLVLHSVGRPARCPSKRGRYLAEHIPGAKLVELPGDDHLPYLGDTEAIARRDRGVPDRRAPARRIDRVLATVLFTDIVGATEKAAQLGRPALARAAREPPRGRARASSRASAAARSTRPATASSPPSTARRAQCAAHARSRGGAAARHRGARRPAHRRVRGDGRQVRRHRRAHRRARRRAAPAPSEVLVSSTVKDLVAGSGLAFEDRGRHALKGVPGEWHLFAVVQPEAAARQLA